MHWPWHRTRRTDELAALEVAADKATARAQRIRNEQARLILALRNTARAIEGKH